MKVPDLFVGRRLFVGCGEPVGLGIGPTEIRGSAYIEGPMIVGNPNQIIMNRTSHSHSQSGSNR